MAPYITRKFKITARAAQQNIDKLVEAKILKESTGHKHDGRRGAEASSGSNAE